MLEAVKMTIEQLDFKVNHKDIEVQYNEIYQILSNLRHYARTFSVALKTVWR